MTQPLVSEGTFCSRKQVPGLLATLTMMPYLQSQRSVRKQEASEHWAVWGCMAVAHPPSGLRQRRQGTSWSLRLERVLVDTWPERGGVHLKTTSQIPLQPPTESVDTQSQVGGPVWLSMGLAKEMG